MPMMIGAMMIITVDTGTLNHEWKIDADVVTFTATLHAKTGDTVLRTETTSRSDKQIADELVDLILKHGGKSILVKVHEKLEMVKC
jgi:hypothetical protein